MEKNNQLILALDVTDRNKALDVAEKVYEYVDAVKIGYPLVLKTGIGIIEDISSSLPVIADFKVADIPNTNRLICEQVFNSGADAVIVHGFTGRDSLDACVATAKKYNRQVFVVVDMSHPGSTEFFQQVSEKIAKMAVEAGVSGVVAPATRTNSVENVRKIIGNKLAIISPGVGAQGGSASDVINKGADWVITGRSIYQSDSPDTEAKKVVQEIKNRV
ncbi:orotidine-5'-phosphate decarboxylase [Methanohalobium sp.]|uniref:orotidine-5'-phosphate decarboxylase n=1 Tax=Methanohalobium sp. TaxID=2837493 RepID=UPI0025FC5A9D|nr:orotidine-5'-phosphate decarboxylase [Methanohalobium sp.]